MTSKTGMEQEATEETEEPRPGVVSSPTQLFAPLPLLMPAGI